MKIQSAYKTFIFTEIYLLTTNELGLTINPWTILTHDDKSPISVSNIIRLNIICFYTLTSTSLKLLIQFYITF